MAPLSLPILVESNESGVYFPYRRDRSFANMFLCTKSRICGSLLKPKTWIAFNMLEVKLTDAVDWEVFLPPRGNCNRAWGKSLSQSPA
jgi:hypothetical protein